MINIDFDNGIVEDFTIVLSDRSLSQKGQIVNISDFVCKENLNSADEISFTVHKKLDDREEKLWNEIIDLKLVWIKELNEYFEIRVNIAETTNLVKNITGMSLCEAELSQTLLRNVEINSETDIDRVDYVVTKFYDEGNYKGSLLHRVLEKVPHYSIKHVDRSLMSLQRTFSIDGKSIYDFLVGECSEQFNCLFQFDSTDRSISVYDLYTVCIDCGHRGEFNDICPECGSTNLSYYGEDTTIFVSADNLTDEIRYDTDVDSIKNCFKLEAGDEDMNAVIKSCNPNGSSYLYYFSDEQKKDMPKELVAKIESYDNLVEFYSEEYQGLSEELYNCIDEIIKYESKMMPPPTETGEITASTEAAKLTLTNLSPIGLTTVAEDTSLATVNSALKNFAKVFVKTGYVKVEVDTGKFTYKGVDGQGHNYGNWTGRFKVTSYSNEEDIAYSNTIENLIVTDDYEYYLTQKIQKNISSEDSDDGSVYDVLSITDLSSFKDALTYYCYNRLESFANAIQGIINILIEEKQSDSSCEYYDFIYTPYYDKLTACQNEMNVRSATIKEYEEREQELIKQRDNIQSALDFEKYLGEELYAIFCSYRREDTYKNDNYISDGLDNAEVFKKALEFIETAKQEIVKSGEYQHSISSNLYNFLVMEEFAPIKDKFELGNWLRFQVNDEVYRLRLVSYQISGNNLSSIETEFANLTKTANGVNDIRSILNSAQSMASSYSYISKQAEQGKNAQNMLRDFTKEGLNSSLVNIKNNDKEEVTFDNNGLLCRSYDDIAEDYSPEQLKITHNILCYTSDNWKTVSLGLGKHDYYKYVGMELKKYTDFGLSAKFVTAGYINGSQIIGGEQYSQNYSPTSGSYMNWNTGAFTLAGGRIVYDVYDDGNSNLTFKNVTLDWNSTNSPTISDIDNLSDQLNEMVSELEQLDGRIQTYSQDKDPSTGWSATEKTNHIGDIWYDTKNDLTKRWNGSSWDIVTDSELETLAKSKAQIFTSTPTPPYYKGDLWVQGSSGDIMNCTNTRTSGNYVASDWVKSSKYTDDTLAQEALNKAKQGIADAASGISLANSAQTSANNAQLRAESAEVNAKKYADNQDASLSGTLTKAYKNYSDSKVSALDSQVAKYLGLGGGTLVGSNYVISPYIGGGYLNIASGNKRVIIDPANLTKNGYIFQVHNGSAVTLGIDKDGNATFSGSIKGGTININNRFKVASNGDVTLPSNAKITWSQVTGTDNIATKSNIPTKTSQLTNDSGLAYTSSIPKKLSQLTNDSGYITASAVPTDDEICQLILNNRGTIITKDYIGTLKVVAGSVAAENITGTLIQGKTLIVGGQNNGDGNIVVKNANGDIVCTIDTNGISVNSDFFKFSNKKAIIDGAALAGGVTYTTFVIQDRSYYSECKSSSVNGVAPSSATIKTASIDGIDMTGYTKMKIISYALVGNNYGVSYANYGIDSVSTSKDATSQLFNIPSNTGNIYITYEKEIDISGYNGVHSLKFYQYAKSDSSADNLQSRADIGLTSIILGN